MNLSTQLRIVLLLVGAAIWLAIYLFGKRRATQASPIAARAAETPQVHETPGFIPAEDIDEDEFETPAYMRRQGQREPRQDYEPRIASADDYLDQNEVDESPLYVDDGENHARATTQAQRVDAPDPQTLSPSQPVHADSRFSEPLYTEPVFDSVANEHSAAFSGRREPTVTFDGFVVTDHVTTQQESEPTHYDEPVSVEAEPPTLPNIPIVETPVAAANHGYTHRADPAPAGSSIAPTLSEVVPVPAERVTVRNATQDAAPVSVNKAGTAPRRKIIALRIPMAERVPGVQLLSLLQSERLQHGKFSIFHRMQDAGTVFSVASMVEPGSFDPHTMGEQQFPGVTLFMLLPGPMDGLVAYDQMLSCAQRIAHATGGVLQDERGSKLTPQIMEKLRDEVLDFQHLVGGMATAH